MPVRGFAQERARDDVGEVDAAPHFRVVDLSIRSRAARVGNKKDRRRGRAAVRVVAKRAAISVLQDRSYVIENDFLVGRRALHSECKDCRRTLDAAPGRDKTQLVEAVDRSIENGLRGIGIAQARRGSGRLFDDGPGERVGEFAGRRREGDRPAGDQPVGTRIGDRSAGSQHCAARVASRRIPGRLEIGQAVPDRSSSRRCRKRSWRGACRLDRRRAP